MKRALVLRLVIGNFDDDEHGVNDAGAIADGLRIVAADWRREGRTVELDSTVVPYDDGDWSAIAHRALRN